MITGNSLTIDMFPFARYLEAMALQEIDDNFSEQGRYGNGPYGGGNLQWEQSYRAKTQHGQTLEDTGQLMAAVTPKATSDAKFEISASGESITGTGSGSISLEVSDNKVYAELMQKGGQVSVPVTPKSRRFFWAMYYETEEPYWMWMALSRNDFFVLNIPARPFLTFLDDFPDRVRAKFEWWLGKNL